MISARLTFDGGRSSPIGTGQNSSLSSEAYWRVPFGPLASRARLTSFFVLDAEVRLPTQKGITQKGTSVRALFSLGGRAGRAPRAPRRAPHPPAEGWQEGRGEGRGEGQLQGRGGPWARRRNRRA